MKKVFATLAVCAFAFAFVACGAKKEEAATDVDTVAVVETPAPMDTMAVDTTATDSIK